MYRKRLVSSWVWTGVLTLFLETGSPGMDIVRDGQAMATVVVAGESRAERVPRGFPVNDGAAAQVLTDWIEKITDVELPVAETVPAGRLGIYIGSSAVEAGLELADIPCPTREGMRILSDGDRILIGGQCGTATMKAVYLASLCFNMLADPKSRKEFEKNLKILREKHEKSEALAILTNHGAYIVHTSVGGSPWRIKGVSVNDKQIDTKKLEGKVVLIDFWATYCTHRRPQLDQLEKLYQKYKEKDFQVLIISVDSPQNVGKIKPYFKSRGYTFPVVLDTDSQISRVLKKYKGLPYTILVDKEGKIVYSHKGYKKGEEKLLEKKILACMMEVETEESANE